jgi:hypothetical protein
MRNYIEELGMGIPDDATPATEASLNTPNEDESLVQGSEEPNSDATTDATGMDDTANTETADDSRLSDLQKQIEGMEKRMADKDKYINELREMSKAKEEASEDTTDNDDIIDDFWDDPEVKFKEMQNTMKIQAMQIQETVYANTVDNYWKTVNPEALQEAVATDAEFNQEFNSSAEPYKTAYEYLTNKTKKKEVDSQTLRDSIKAELIKEMGLETKQKKDGVPNINKMGGSSSSTKSQESDDGFASIFGQ